MKNFKMLLPTSLIALSMLTVAGCSEAETQQAEDKAESAMQATENKAEEAGRYAGEKAEDAGEYIDDAVITTKVKAIIFDDDNLNSMQINVETSDGIVQLSGFVDDAADVDTAENLAETVKGVKGIENDIQVRKND